MVLGGYCGVAIGHPYHGPYHDHEYGFPLTDESELFGRLMLEVNQAGLSWLTILKKQETFRAAYEGWNVDRVAAYGEEDKARLLADRGIIRNKLKVDAAIENARAIQRMRKSHGSFADWLAAHHPRSKAEWVRLFKKTFRFTGGEITGEFLMSIGYLSGAHQQGCIVYGRIEKLSPPWMSNPPSEAPQ
ncbi:MAG: DNA-3-methyladenine glycosylase I [Gemmatimonadota bacterium]|nr:MAG: DNA-3-methyladenine glycosylase I [Gemmatimonadota bacterium]